MFTFRIRISIDENQFRSLRKDEEISEQLKNHIYQQIIDQIKNMDSGYY